MVRLFQSAKLRETKEAGAYAERIPAEMWIARQPPDS